ncbi:tRNA (adenosine(37)-N6)-dimethylallyltransferase MiaA [Tundrisphaera sp. TA3]|uniref:tRNA (adenosine(37)-N6)-dimethylallyltransferase MiaA n=1 Tax=Tundrisphaera sp. TA3 TaxID=3435775 RepID=UPI003EB985EC
MNDADANRRFHRAVYLAGPTASGKTAVGVALARRIGAEVIALDALTLYRGMDIGTAKPTPRERGRVPHHLIDVLEPWESASVADYRDRAAAVLSDLETRHVPAMFVGGTPMYLKTLLRGLFDGPGAVPDLRLELEEEAARIGDPAMHARLAALDPATAARIHPNDRRRVVRALEVIAATGRPFSEQRGEHETPAPAGVAVFALDRPRDELHRRINARVGQMFDAGLVDEVRRLRDAPRPIGPVASQGVGYREVLDMLAGEFGEAEAMERIRARTRQFAKRQTTWFRGLSEVEFFPVPHDEPAEQTAARLAQRLERRDPICSP